MQSASHDGLKQETKVTRQEAARIVVMAVATELKREAEQVELRASEALGDEVQPLAVLGTIEVLRNLVDRLEAATKEACR